eukprot:CAMPEP_0113888756 /NCGR_PEP_ID=MMETSP0780_2-20120614/13064_1 /TAXON_ID=652834 /ORGANISM="Palpitomonas bilix" /LENGTH=58 /DNA_ID=CAMNT_0000877671 /DNA_START=22 /DNA_END=198 /DNA_ORIENTATION=- /assembly_acc=CAM_ASM_000599
MGAMTNFFGLTAVAFFTFSQIVPMMMESGEAERMSKIRRQSEMQKAALESETGAKSGH